MSTIAAFGEIMLRLSPPGRERLFQSPRLETCFGGGEANAAAALAGFGHRVRYVTVLPSNPLGDAALAELRRAGVETDFIIRRPGRLGLYFAETGADQRPSRVVYDRSGSALALSRPGDVAWTDVFAGAQWFHVTGITPAVSASAAELAAEAVRSAKAAGLQVSLDLNYRSKLWAYGKSAPEVMRPLTASIDLLVANEEDIQKALGFGQANGAGAPGLDPAAYERLTAEVMSSFPNLSRVAVTLRESRSADRNGWSAVLRSRDGFLAGPTYEIADIVDRIGAGDAFAAGLIHGLLTWGTDREALDFAAAASCLKHAIPGDFNRVDEAEVLALVRGEAGGRIRR